jgi:cytoskeleton protein RodZ
VRGRPPFELVIGNAAHVRLTYDGNPVDLEPHIRGEVARLTLN